MLDPEKRDHHESTPSRLPIQTPGQGSYGKQQSELDLAWTPATPAAGARSSQGLFTKAGEGINPSFPTCSKRD